MRQSIWFSIFFLCVADGFAQYADTYQTASIYKQNQVKARVMMYDRARFKSRVMVDFFNRNGNVIEHDLYDTLGEKFVSRELLTYDSMQQVIHQVIYYYSHYDTASRKYLYAAIPDTVDILNQYDSLKRLLKQTYVNRQGITVHQSIFTYDPLSQRKKTFFKDSTNTETNLDFDVRWIENKREEILHTNTGKNYTRVFTVKNRFDKSSGKVLRRKITEQFASEGFKWLPYYQEEEYEYMSGGLLIRRISSERSDNQLWRVGLLFDYKFW